MENVPPVTAEEFDEQDENAQLLAKLLGQAFEVIKAKGYVIEGASFAMVIRRDEQQEDEARCVMAGRGDSEQLGNLAVDLLRAAEYMAAEEASAEGQTLQ
jgi:hypothetical protein